MKNGNYYCQDYCDDYDDFLDEKMLQDQYNDYLYQQEKMNE